MTNEQKKRNNHYVPEWYQKGFLLPGSSKLHYLNLRPDKIFLPDGAIKFHKDYNPWTPSQCFSQKDLYTTFFNGVVNDEVETFLFGNIDNYGSRAVQAFIRGQVTDYHDYFTKFFEYIDAQKLRTPKGLDWIKSKYSNLDQVQLMVEMQAIRNIHCNIWAQSVREIVSAEKSSIKFILSDHPVTIYNYACSPETNFCTYPEEPTISLKATQTIFPLNMDHCLILTNYEYAKNPEIKDPTKNRTNARNFSNPLVRTDIFIRSRVLTENEVEKINFIMKTRAKRYIAAGDKSWLFPEKNLQCTWPELRSVLFPPENELYRFGGEIYVGYEDGSTYYQDAFGRTSDSSYLRKPERRGRPGVNEPCICGSGKKYKKCCRGKDVTERGSDSEYSIRERNLMFYRMINDVLGVTEDKAWEDVRRELSNEQVKKIHEYYGLLWPADTNILDLLPKPDPNCLRALYEGVIHPKVIIGGVVSQLLYFDEIIVLSPFANPAFRNPEYSPTHDPHQYKQETLKNIFLFMTLIPFIESGYVHFIPDPSEFDGHMRKQIWRMAQERFQYYKINDKHLDQMRKLRTEDLWRSHRGMPKDRQRRMIRQTSPDISDSDLEDIIEYWELKQKADPLALLQEDLCDHGGQLIIFNLLPNFELGMVLAQLTNSLILTDSHHRWGETINAFSQVSRPAEAGWNDLMSCINDLEYVTNISPHHVLNLRKSGRLGAMRKVFRKIFYSIKEKNSSSLSNAVAQELKKELIRANEISKKELVLSQESDVNDIHDPSPYNCLFKFNSVISSGGASVNNVQRLLLASGSTQHMKSVYMAMLSELALEESDY